MMKLRFLVGLFLFSCLITCQKFEGDPFALEELLPEDTLLYAVIPNSEQLNESFKKTTLYKFINNEEIQDFIRPAIDFIKNWKEKELEPQLQEKLRLTSDNLVSLISGPISFAVIDLPAGEGQSPDLVFSLGAAQTERFASTFTKIKEAMAKERGATETTFEIEKHKVIEIGDENSKLFYTLIDNHYVFTTSKERITAMIKKPASPLATQDNFKKPKDKLRDTDQLFHLYVNGRAILEKFKDKIGLRAMSAINSIGLNIDSISLSVSFEGKLIKSQLYLSAPGERKGILKLLSLKSASSKHDKFVPADAIGYSKFTFDPVELYDTLLDVIKAIDEKAYQQVTTGLKAFEVMLGGISLRNDLFSSLGTSWAAYSKFAGAQGLLADYVFIVDLRDARNFEDTISKILNTSNIKLEEINFKGGKIKFFSIPIKPEDQVEIAGKEMRLSIPVSYMIREDSLFISLNPNTLKRTIIQMQEKDFKNISTNPDFASLSESLPKDAGFVSYADLGRPLGNIYDILQVIALFFRDTVNELQGDKRIIDLARLPMGDTLAKYLGHSISSLQSDTDGILCSSRSTLGISTSSITATVIIAAIAIPRMLSAKHKANEAAAIGGLKSILHAEMLWKNQDPDGNNIAEFWTADTAALYYYPQPDGTRVELMFDDKIAKADPAITKWNKDTSCTPYGGYYFAALKIDEEGSEYSTNTLSEDAGPYKEGDACMNPNKFAFVAYPAKYGTTAKHTFIVNEYGVIYKKDLGTGADENGSPPINSWPDEAPQESGWAIID